VLGPLLEENLRRAMMISLALLIASIGLLAAMAAPRIRGFRRKAFAE
jgi:TctA family transporter